MKIDVVMACCIAAIARVLCFASTIELPAPPSGVFPDTESSTNLTCSLRTEGRSVLEISISLNASESNNLEVAFGCDADSDGEMSIEEEALAIGWDSGHWFLRDDATGELLVAQRSGGLRQLDFRLAIDSSLRSCGLLALDDDVVFACGIKTTPDSFFNPRWDTARVTARGFRNTSERLAVAFSPAGFSVHFR